MTIEIKQLGTEAIDSLHDLSIKTFTDTFAKDNTSENMADYLNKHLTKEKLLAEMKQPLSFFYGLYTNDILAGFIKINMGADQSEDMGNQSFEIERLYIEIDFKAKGFGSHLMKKAEEVAYQHSKSHIWLGVWEYNQPAIHFYEKNGFKMTGSSHTFTLGNDPQTDYLMEKYLD